MVAFGWTVAALATAFSAVRAVTQVDPIVIKGSKFFYKSNGTQFYIRGIAYQQDVGAAGASSSNNDLVDPLADSAGCQRDIPYLQKLRTNAVRVYAIDPTQNHDDCMSALADAGIYVMADLAAPNESIISTQPTWNADLYARYTSVVDSLAKYTNTMGFFAGNEVIFTANVSDSAPYVKAAVRDMKAYIKEKNYRTIGIGYAADDDPSIRVDIEDYLNCGDSSATIDFFGYNIYSWCGNSNLQTSHYADRTQEFSDYNVPAFFAEYGCNNPEPREFTDTLALYGSQMNGVWSGGFVFEYFQAANKYGLVTVDGSSVSTLADFGHLSTQIAKVSATGVNSNDYNPTNTAQRSCPAATSGWEASTALPPTPNEQLCSCMVKNLTCNAKANVDPNAFGALFNASCPASGACNGIFSSGSTGQYGAYSMCNSAEQLAWAFNNYYFNNPGSSDACDFSGNATKQNPQLANGCSGLLSQAGAAGTGQVTSQPSGTGAIGSSSGSASSSSAAVALTVPPIDMRVVGVGIYVTVAAIAGAGIIFL